MFDLLPASALDVERALGLAPNCGSRLMRALRELALVNINSANLCHATHKGAHLRADHDLSLSAAASHWGDLSLRAWQGLSAALRTGKPALDIPNGDFFGWMAGQPDELAATHRAFAAHARHDYASLPRVWDFSVHHSILN